MTRKSFMSKVLDLQEGQMKQRHMWVPWSRVQRCARRGCAVLRKGSEGNYFYRLPRVEWGRERPSCTGHPTTNKP